jgi:hypothetical protein
MRNSEINNFCSDNLTSNEDDMPLSMTTMTEAESSIHKENTQKKKAHEASQVVSSTADAAFG